MENTKRKFVFREKTIFYLISMSLIPTECKKETQKSIDELLSTELENTVILGHL